MESTDARTHIETVKEESGGLSGTIRDELGSPEAGFSDDNAALLKFHGIYQQINRDLRRESGQSGDPAPVVFMVRAKFPSGEITPEQYLLCNALAGKYADGGLRITCRQDLQFHGVPKASLRSIIEELAAGGMSTFGAAGDVVRNVVAPPLADIDPRYAGFGLDLLGLAHELTGVFAPRTQSYRAVWGDADFSGADAGEVEEPFYQKSYLPRKFKIGISADFDNSSDLLANDIGLLAVIDGGRIRGYEVFVGGGLSFSRASGDTDSQLAEPLAFVQPELVVPIVVAVATIFREHGCRTNRKRARLKYLLRDWGIERFREEVALHVGAQLEKHLGVLPSGRIDYLGWHDQADPSLKYLGIRLAHGQIKDGAANRVRTGLAEMVARFSPGIRLTPKHDIILTDIARDDVAEIQEILDAAGITATAGNTPLQCNAAACPALPYCGMALAEAERILPDILRSLAERGYGDLATVIRMSGCPNGCSRPRLAEIGLIGAGAVHYDVYSGGSPLALRLNQKLLERVHVDAIPSCVANLLMVWRRDSPQQDETFGDWSLRVGAEGLRNALRELEDGV